MPRLGEVGDGSIGRGRLKAPPSPERFVYLGALGSLAQVKGGSVGPIDPGTVGRDRVALGGESRSGSRRRLSGKQVDRDESCRGVAIEVLVGRIAFFS